jgi:hypothetical protein
VLGSREDYNLIALKGLQTFPQLVFYDAAYPYANLYVWPAPTNQYTIHISVKTQINNFASLTQTMNLPGEYQEAIIYNLAARLRPMYGLPPEQSITALAKQSLNVIRGANAQIPRLTLPAQVTRDTLYNIYGDQSY